MSDQFKTHPRTQQMIDSWRMRGVQRRRSLGTKSLDRRQKASVAMVVDVADNGDVLIDRLTDENGNGEWLTPVNGFTPILGSSVVVQEVAGNLTVVGPVGDGDFDIQPRQEFSQPYYFVPDELDPLQDFHIIDWTRISTYPFFNVNRSNPRILFGAPPFYSPNHLHWHDHFLSGEPVSGRIGREGWGTWGDGNALMGQSTDSKHTVRLNSGGTSGFQRGVNLGQTSAHPLLYLCTNAVAAAITEGWWVFRPNHDTSARFRFGFADEWNVNAINDGIYWEFASGTPNTITFVVRNDGVTVHSQNVGEAWVLSGPYVVSIRIEPSLDGDEVEGYNYITGSMWGAPYGPSSGISKETPGIGNFLKARNTVQWKTTAITAFYGSPGVVCRTLTGATRSIDIDYMGGFHYTPNLFFDGG